MFCKVRGIFSNFCSWDDGAELENREKRGVTTRFVYYVYSEVEYICPLSLLLKDSYLTFSLGVKLQYVTVLFLISGTGVEFSLVLYGIRQYYVKLTR
jgi:hypothetical protein